MAETKKVDAAPAASTTSPAKGGKPLPIILIVVGIIALLCICGSILAFIIVRKAQKEADKVFDKGFENIVEESIEDAIEKESGGDSDFELGGELPDDFPNDVPLYKNSEVIYGGTTTEDGLTSISVTLSVKAAGEDVNDFYVEELEDEGWEIVETSSYGGYVITAEKGDREVSVIIYGGDEDSSYIITITEK